jgi:ABC-type phosphate/phosphonate transport system substrate-binding protein
LFLSVFSAAGQTTGPVKVKSITLGLVSSTSQKEIEAHFQNFVRYVARKLGSGPDTEGKVVIVPTPLQMAKLLEEKKIDFYIESPYPTYLINKHRGPRYSYSDVGKAAWLNTEASFLARRTAKQTDSNSSAAR